MHPLDGPRRKLDRAAVHIKTLNYAVSRWYDSKPFPIVAEHFNAEQTVYIYRFEAKAVPIDIGIVAGDAIHNMRSALDHIAWQLQTLTPLSGRRKGWEFDIQFPIFLSKSDEGKLNRFLQYIPRDAGEVIKSLQPYNAPDGIKPEFHALWLLNQLSNADKHRIVTIGGAALEIDISSVKSQDWLNEYTVEITVPVLEKNLPPLPPKMVYYLSLGHGIIGNGIRIEALPVLHKDITEVVLPRFERFFP